MGLWAHSHRWSLGHFSSLHTWFHAMAARSLSFSLYAGSDFRSSSILKPSGDSCFTSTSQNCYKTASIELCMLQEAFVDYSCLSLRWIQNYKAYETCPTCQLLWKLRIRMLFLWSIFSMTDLSSRESCCSSRFTLSDFSATSELLPVLPPLLSSDKSARSRCSWTSPSTLLCKLSGITTCLFCTQE